MENNTENVLRKLAPDPFSILINNAKQPLHQEILLKVRYFDKGLSKSIENFFLSISIPFHGQSYKKQKGPGTNHLSLFRPQKISEKVLFLLYIV